MREIDTFLPSWRHARGLARDFIDTVPDHRWDHEALHHGQWSFYATLGGFETPDGWS
jgi:hypothetical protein